MLRINVLKPIRAIAVPVTVQEQLDYDHLTAPFNANYVFFWGEEGISPNLFKDLLTVELPFQEAQVAFGLWTDRTMGLSERCSKFVIEDDQVGEQTVSIFAKVKRGELNDEVMILCIDTLDKCM